jgi:hypothetical protein
MLLLALRRWCSSLTLSSADSVPTFHGLWVGAIALGLLIVIVAICQSPAIALRQLFDLPGHVRLVSSAVRRVWFASRLVCVAMAFTVISWTASQALVFARDSGKSDLLMLVRSRGTGELALEQGSLAALTPLRDVAGLGDNFPLLVCATILLFRGSMQPSFGGRTTGVVRFRSNWTTAIWCAGAFYAFYRVVMRGAGTIDLPVGGCLVVEAAVVPMLMLLSDAYLLSWFLVELRDSTLGRVDEPRIDALAPVALMPAATVACLSALPARYVASLVWLVRLNLPPSVNATAVGRYIRWQLGNGLIDLQAGSLVVVGIVGVIAWSRGSFRGILPGYFRLLRLEGGHLAAALTMAGAAAAALSAVSYLIVLLLPAQTWVLNAADSYAHFATLPIGLWLLAALIELFERALPEATLAAPPGVDRGNVHSNGQDELVPAVGEAETASVRTSAS